MPISIRDALLMTIVSSPTGQTVRAYPSGGGAYIVSKDNLAPLPGSLQPPPCSSTTYDRDRLDRVGVSHRLGVPARERAPVFRRSSSVWFVTISNLRGAAESGTLFAIPTTLRVSILVMLVVGFTEVPRWVPRDEEVEVIHDAATTASAIGVFAILKAFSSGATALTGVEAISNGVPAFRRPQARNAANAGDHGRDRGHDVLGISWLSVHIPGTVASDARSVPRDRMGSVRRWVRLLLCAVLHGRDPDPGRGTLRTRTHASRRSWPATLHGLVSS